MKICAVVVTCNRKDLLRECLESLLAQTRLPDEIFVVDNASGDGTKEMMQKEFSDLKYIQLLENIGGAGGFHEGIKGAYEAGHDWIWIMDDDAEPLPDSLKKLTEMFDVTQNMPVALASYKVNEKREPLFFHMQKINYNNFLFDIFSKKRNRVIPEFASKLYVETNFSSFVGLLISRIGIEKIGYPRKEMFLFNDDIDYLHRLCSIGKIYIVKKSVILHKEASSKNTDTNSKPTKNYIKLYYMYRNAIHLATKYQKSGKARLWLSIAYFYVCFISRILFLEKEKRWKIRIISRAFIDGLTNKLGKLGN